MGKIHAIAIVIILLFFGTAVAASSNPNVFSDFFGFFKNSITGFTGFSGSASGGMNLTVWDETDTGGEPFTNPPKYRSEQVKFFANLTNATDGAIINDSVANVSIDVFGFFSSQMSFNSSILLWEVSGNIYQNGTFGYNVTANSSVYSPIFIVVNDTANISSSCGDFLDNYYANGDYVLCPDYYNVSDSDGNGVIIINSSNIVLNLNGSRFYSDSTGTGINNTNFTNVTIINGAFVNFSKGIYLKDANFSYLGNLTLLNNFNDIILQNSGNSIITGIFSNLSRNFTVYLISVESSRIINSSFYDSNLGINLSASSNNILDRLYFNNIANTAGSFLYIESGDYNNVVNNSNFSAFRSNLSIPADSRRHLRFYNSVNTTLENSFVGGTTGNYEPGIVASGSSGLLFRNNTFHPYGQTTVIGYSLGANVTMVGNRFQLGDIGNEVGSYFLAGNGILFENNTFSGQGGDALSFISGKDIVIKNNYFTGRENSGGIVALGNVQNVTVIGNTLEPCCITFGRRAFYTENSKNISFINNNVINPYNYYDFKALNVENLSVINNSFNSTSASYSSPQFEFINVSSMNFAGNEIYGGGKGGISIDNSSAIAIENNSISNSLTYGIYLLNSNATGTLFNNTFFNGSADGILLINSTATIINNTIVNNSYNGINSTSSNISMENNTICYNGRYGILSVSTNILPSDYPAKNNICGQNGIGKSFVSWLAQVRVVKVLGNLNISGAQVNVSERNNITPAISAVTDSSGLTAEYLLRQYILNNSDVQLNFTPHNITASKTSSGTFFSNITSGNINTTRTFANGNEIIIPLDFVECGDNLMQSYNMINDLNCTSGSGLGLAASNIVLNCNGHILYGNSSLFSNGVTIRNSNNVTVTNCTIQDFYWGIVVYNGSSAMIVNNSFSGTYFAISDSVFAPNLEIINNTILNSGTGIEELTSSENSTIQGNIIYNTSSGISTFQTGALQIIENNISNSDTAISLLYTSSAPKFTNISGNYLFNNSYGIMTYNPGGTVKNSTLLDNTILSNGIGIYFPAITLTQTNRISNNNISGNEEGILLDGYVSQTVNLNITNNTIKDNNGSGINLLRSVYFSFTPSQSNVTITGNNISGNQMYGVYTLNFNTTPVQENLIASNNIGANTLGKVKVDWGVDAKVIENGVAQNGWTVKFYEKDNATAQSMGSTGDYGAGITDSYALTEFIINNSDVQLNFTPHNFTANYSSRHLSKSEYMDMPRIPYVNEVTLSNNGPAINLDKPDNDAQFNETDSIVFNFTATDDSGLPLNCSLYINNTRNATNSSVENNTITNFTVSLAVGSYSWFVNCTDGGGLSNISEIRLLAVNDTSPPVVTGLVAIITNETVTANLTTNESSNLTINYGITTGFGSIFQNSSFIILHHVFLSGLLNNTPYYYNITVCDIYQNCKITGPFSFTTEQNVPELPQVTTVRVSGGGAMAGAGVVMKEGVIVVTETPKEAKIREGVKQDFIVEGYEQKHYVTPTQVNEDSIVVSVDGNEYTIPIGSDLKLTLTGGSKIIITASQAVVSRKINSETITEAYLILVKISLPVAEVPAEKAPAEEIAPQPEKPAEIPAPVQKPSYIPYLVVIGALIIMLFVALFSVKAILKHKNR